MRNDYLYNVIMRGIGLSVGLGGLAILVWILIDAS